MPIIILNKWNMPQLSWLTFSFVYTSLCPGNPTYRSTVSYYLLVRFHGNHGSSDGWSLCQQVHVMQTPVKWILNIGIHQFRDNVLTCHIAILVSFITCIQNESHFNLWAFASIHLSIWYMYLWGSLTFEQWLPAILPT